MPEISDQEIARELEKRGKKAPRVTQEQIDSTVVDVRYWQPEGTTVTIALVILTNGFNVIGESAAASPENFVKEIGEAIALEDAKKKIWKLEGYLLRDKLYYQAKQELATQELTSVSVKERERLDEETRKDLEDLQDDTEVKYKKED